MFTIYFDMDGVLCNFNKRCDEFDCWRKDVHKCDWKKMKEIGPIFWADMDKIKLGMDLLKKTLKWATDKNVTVGIFSAVHLFEGKIGKREWLKKYCPEIKPENVIIINNGNFKHEQATPDSLLVDDKIANVENYRNAGGCAVHFDINKSDIEMFAEIVAMVSDKV